MRDRVSVRAIAMIVVVTTRPRPGPDYGASIFSRPLVTVAAATRVRRGVRVVAARQPVWVADLPCDTLDAAWSDGVHLLRAYSSDG